MSFKLLEQLKLFLLKSLIVLVPLLIIPNEHLTDYFTYPKALFLWLLCLCLLFLTLIELYNKQQRFKKSDLWLAFGFLSLIFISACVSDFQDLVWIGQLNQHNGVLTYFSFIILFFTSYSLKAHRIALIKLIVITSSVVSLIGILQYFDISLWEPDGIRVYWKRIYSTIGNANWLSGIMLLALPLAFYLQQNQTNKLFWSFIIIINSAALFASGTRGAYLAFFIVLFTWLFNHRRSLMNMINPLLALIIGFCFANFKNNYPIKRIISTQININKGINGDLSAGEHRLFIYKTSLPLVKEHWILGSGPDTFGRIYPQHEIKALLRKEKGNNANFAKNLNIAHNEYIQLAVTLGFGALLIFLAFLSKGIMAVFYNYSAFNFYLGLGVIGLAIYFIFTDNSLAVASFFWILIGLKEDPNEHNISSRRTNVLIKSKSISYS